MRIVRTFAAVLLGSAVAIGLAAQLCAQEGRSAPMPDSTPIMPVVMDNPNARIFADVVRISELAHKDLDLDGTEVTFLAPQDATCSDEEKAYLYGLTSKDAARAYVLNHAFKGQITVLPDDDGRRGARAYYFPEAGGRESLRGRVSIEENHPFEMPLLGGKTVVISIHGGLVHFGARSALLHISNGASNGDEMELDGCAVL
jgi:hypothetical protein